MIICTNVYTLHDACICGVPEAIAEYALLLYAITKTILPAVNSSYIMTETTWSEIAVSYGTALYVWPRNPYFVVRP